MADYNDLDPEFRRRLSALIQGLPPEVRSHITLISGYRSNEQQQGLWDAALKKYGSEAEARKWVAPPGNSMHNRGWAADIGYDGKGLGDAPEAVINLLHQQAPLYHLNFPLPNENWHIEPAEARSIGATRSVGSAVTGDTPTGAPTPVTAGTPYGGIINNYARQNNLDPSMLARLVNTESGFNAKAVSSAGALGLAQLMPATAKGLGVTNPTDPEQNIAGGAKYLRQMMDRYNNDPRLALAAYNGGPGLVDKAGGDFSKLPTSVQAYANNILGGKGAPTGGLPDTSTGGSEGPPPAQSTADEADTFLAQLLAGKKPKPEEPPPPDPAPAAQADTDRAIADEALSTGSDQAPSDITPYVLRNKTQGEWQTGSVDTAPSQGAEQGGEVTPSVDPNIPSWQPDYSGVKPIDITSTPTPADYIQPLLQTYTDPTIKRITDADLLTGYQPKMSTATNLARNVEAGVGSIFEGGFPFTPIIAGTLSGAETAASAGNDLLARIGITKPGDVNLGAADWWKDVARTNYNVNAEMANAGRPLGDSGSSIVRDLPPALLGAGKLIPRALFWLGNEGASLAGQGIASVPTQDPNLSQVAEALPTGIVPPPITDPGRAVTASNLPIPTSPAGGALAASSLIPPVMPVTPMKLALSTLPPGPPLIPKSPDVPVTPVQVAALAAAPQVGQPPEVPVAPAWFPFISQAAAAEAHPEPPPPPNVVADQKAADLMGWVAALTSGHVIAGYGFKAVKNYMGTPRPFELDPAIAPKGTMSIANWRDYATAMAQNVYAPFTKALNLSGINPDLERVARRAMFETRQSGAAAAYNMMNEGRGDTVGVKYSAVTSVGDLVRMDQKDPRYSQYVHYQDIINRMDHEGLPRLAGQTRNWYVTEMANIRNALDTGAPGQLDKYVDGMRENIEQIRQAKSGLGTSDAQAKANLVYQARPLQMPIDVPVDAPINLPPAGSLIFNQGLTSVRAANENAAKTAFVDAVRSTDLGKQLFNQMSKKTYDDNEAAYKNSTVILDRNGVREYYATDPMWADIMRMDPHYVAEMLPRFIGTLNRTVMTMGTGAGNPGYALTAFYRNWQANRFGVPAGRSGAGLLQSAWAIPRVLGPKAALAISRAIDGTLATTDYSGLWSAIDPARRQAMSTYLAKVWHDSQIAMIEEHGAGSAGGSLVDLTKGNSAAIQQAQGASQYLSAVPRGLYNTLLTVLHTTHASNNAAYVFKNMALISGRVTKQSLRAGDSPALAAQKAQQAVEGEIPYLVQEAAGLGGDPRMSGQTFITPSPGQIGINATGTGIGRPRMLQPPGAPAIDSMSQRASQYIGQPIARTLGVAGQVAREAVPWGNVTMQGLAKVGESYLRDPLSFTMRLWTYVLGPSTAAYFWNKSNGDDVTDYQMNGQSRYDSAMKQYVYVPSGNPNNKMLEQGLKLPGAQEFAPIRALWEAFLHHAMSNTQTMFTLQEDLQHVLEMAIPTVLFPPTDAAEVAMYAAHGEEPPQNMFADPIRPYKAPFAEPGSIPAYLTNWIKVFGGQIGHMGMLAYNSMHDAYAHQPDGGAANVGTILKAGLDEVGNSLLQDTPIAGPMVSHALGVDKPMSTGSWTDWEAAQNKKALDDLSKFWTMVGRYTQADPITQAYPGPRQPQIDVSKLFQKGSDMGPDILGSDEGTLGGGYGSKEAEYPGYQPAAPVNDLYKKFAFQAMQMLMTNAKSSDLKGFVELNKRRSYLQEAIQSMRGVTAGYAPEWLDRIKKNPDMLDELGYTGGNKPIDRNSAIKAQNKFTKELHDINAQMIIAVRKAEDVMSQQTVADDPNHIGYNIRLDDLNPYSDWKVAPDGTVTDSSGKFIKKMDVYKRRAGVEQ